MFWENNGWIVSLIALVILVLFLIIMCIAKKGVTTKSLAAGAVALAFSYVLSLIPVPFRLPQGGSVTVFSVLPLIVFCAIFGFKQGVIICVAYGLLDATVNPYIIHPIQFLLDYPLAYGFISLAGLFHKKEKLGYLILGAALGIFGRYICSTLSGAIFFAEYANLEKYATVLIYSLAYNSYVLVDGIIEIFGLVVVDRTKALKQLKRMFLS